MQTSPRPTAVSSRQLQHRKGVVDVDDLSVSFRSRDTVHEVLTSVRFQVNPGEFVCLLGPSGCGKSTLLNAIAGFVAPSQGSVTVDGNRVTRPGADRGFVFQQYSLLPWKTTFQNVEMGLKYQKMPKSER
ncbi:MAG: ATP-binding cassette domain-containing protein, partial [Cyanobacteria bacterium J06555_12]